MEQILDLFLGPRYADPDKSKWSHPDFFSGSHSCQCWGWNWVNQGKKAITHPGTYDASLLGSFEWSKRLQESKGRSHYECRCILPWETRVYFYLWHGMLFHAVKSLQPNFSCLFTRFFISLVSSVQNCLQTRARIVLNKAVL